MGGASTVAIGVTGLAVGWLVGMALSPAVGTVIGSLMAVAAGALAVKGSGEQEGADSPRSRARAAWALAAFAVFLAVGATVGLLGRTVVFPRLVQRYGPAAASPDSSVAKGSPTSRASPSRPETSDIGFYSTLEPPTACDELLAAAPERLASAFRTSTDAFVRILGAAAEEERLPAVRDAVCRR